MLAGDAGPGGVRLALRAPAVRGQVRAALETMVDDPAAVTPCRLVRTKFKPGHKLTAWFDVGVGTSRRSMTAVWSTQPPPPAPAGSEDLEAEARERGLAGPFRRLFHDEPGRPRVSVAPFDDAFPRLVALSDPVHAAVVSGLPGPVGVRTVRYRPGQRHVLRYTHRRASVFVKLYPDAAAARPARVLGEVAGLLGQAAPRPEWLDAEHAFVVPAVAGRPLSRLLAGDGAPDDLTAAGRLLGRLHGAPAGAIDGLPARTLDAELAGVRRAAEALGCLLPRAGTAVAQVLDRTPEVLGGLASEDPVLLHGDYKADHVLVGPTSTVIDFDRCGTGDPALDLAKFLADLAWWLPDAPTLAAAERAFLAGYGCRDSARLARARALEPLFSVKMAARRVRLHDAGWERRASALVDSAAGRLERLVRA